MTEQTIIVNPLVTNIVSIVVALLLVLTLILPKLIKHILHSIILLSFGLIPLLHSFSVIGFTIPSWPILTYALTGIVIISARTLIVDGFKEEEKVIKIGSIVAGILILLAVTIPSLSAIGALTFKIELPEMVISIVYIISGILLLIGTAIMRE